MNLSRLILCVILLAACVSGCQGKTPEPETDASNTIETISEAAPVTPNPLLPQPGAESMKGYELYSWQADGAWYFSVLVGTNREKTLEEIQSPDARLEGVEALRPVLEAMPAGQYVTWTSRDSLAFPPDELLRQVQEICQKRGLELGIVK